MYIAQRVHTTLSPPHHVMQTVTYLTAFTVTSIYMYPVYLTANIRCIVGIRASVRNQYCVFDSSVNGAVFFTHKIFPFIQFI